jgi:hypothetical protein
VEAGMIHFYLWQQLWRKLKGSFRVQPLFLDRTALQLPNRHYLTYSPGDQLTLAYVFHPGLSCDKWESLMAARSIVYSKIIQKPIITRMFCCNLSTWRCWCKKQTFQLNQPGTDIHAVLTLPDSVSPKEIMGSISIVDLRICSSR